MSLNDWLGTPIEVGSLVLYPTSQGSSSAVTNMARVTDIYEGPSSRYNEKVMKLRLYKIMENSSGHAYDSVGWSGKRKATVEALRTTVIERPSRHSKDDDLIRSARFINHSGDAGELFWDETNSSVLWVAGVTDGSSNKHTRLDKISEMFHSFPFVENVFVEYDPPYGDGRYVPLGKHGKIITP